MLTHGINMRETPRKLDSGVNQSLRTPRFILGLVISTVHSLFVPGSDECR